MGIPSDTRKAQTEFMLRSLVRYLPHLKNDRRFIVVSSSEVGRLNDPNVLHLILLSALEICGANSPQVETKLWALCWVLQQCLVCKLWFGIITGEKVRKKTEHSLLIFTSSCEILPQNTKYHSLKKC